MRKLLMAGIAAAGLMATAASAQQGNVEGRVGKLESEMRAVQRKVFPGGGQYLEPQITAPPTSVAAPGTPAESAVTDLAQRVAAVESQLATLTGQVEQAQYRNRQLQEQFDAYRRTVDDRLKAIEAGPAAIAPAAASAPLDEPAATPPARGARPTPTRSARPTPVTPEPEEEPAAVPSTAAVTRPSSGDRAEDGYLYGFRLWQAKRYPEAQAALKKVVADHPRSRRASYAQNLLGRAYLDEGKPSLASMAFYDNYKKMPDGERAPDSLLYLGQALVKLNKPADACKVYAELADVYGGKLSTALQGQLAQSRTAARCK